MRVNFIGMSDTTPESPELAVLRAQAQLAAQKVNEAEAAEREAKQRAEQEQLAKDAGEARQLFDPLARETEREFARFAALFREACVSLGRLSKSAGLLTSLYNRVTASRALSDPVMLTTVQTLARCPNPLPALLDEGFAADTGAGWNWACPIVPVVPKGEHNV